MSTFDELTADIRRVVANGNYSGSTEIIKFIQKKLNDGLNDVVTKVRQIENIEVPDRSYRMSRTMVARLFRDSIVSVLFFWSICSSF